MESALENSLTRCSYSIDSVRQHFASVNRQYFTDGQPDAHRQLSDI